jgi:meso-butanediol dehydrogenase / (S,S)-butanediol dehydrogenase / diacetyl reductase
MSRLKDRVALVTGGSQGLGRAIVQRLANEGAAVAVVARHEPAIDEIVASIRAGGAKAIGLVADVTDEAATTRYVSETVRALGRVDILVNSAGTIEVAPLVDTSAEAWDRVLAVNTRGVFLACRAVAGQMIAQGGGGRIVNLASGAGRRGGPNLCAYSASKFAVIGFTQSIAAELAPHAITVNACCPGHVTSTPMWDTIDAAFAALSGGVAGAAKATAVAEVPLGRSGRPEEIAAAVAFLASDDSSFMTGESVLVDGGLVRY